MQEAQVAPALDAEPPGQGIGEGVILLLFTILTLAASAFVLVTSEQSAVDDPAEKAARGEITGLHAESLMRRANLERALEKVGGRLVSNIRVSPERIDVTVRDGDGARQILSIDPAFGVQERDFGVGEDAAVRPAEIDTRGPERMTRAVAKRTGLRPAAVDYVTMSFSGTGERSWYMALDSGPARVRQWIAAADGSDLRRPGEMSAKDRAASEAQRRRVERERRRADLLFTRRSNCLRRARDAEAASRCIDRFAP
jgi:hypothetical protein